MTAAERKELRLFTLKGDVYTCRKDGMSRLGTRNLLILRYVNSYSDIKITREEFDNILDAEYDK